MKTDAKTSKMFKKCIYKSLCFVNRYSKLYFTINLLYIIVQGLLPAFLLFIMQNAINLLQKSNGDNFIDILYLLLLYMGLNIFNSLVSLGYNYYSVQFNLKFTKYINIKLLNKAADLKVRDFENSETYDIINRAQAQNGSNILSYISENFLVVKAVLTITSTSIILIKFNWLIIILILLTPMIRCVVTTNIDKKWYIMRKERTAKERKKWYLNYLMMLGTAAKEIKLFGISQYLIQKYKDITTDIINQDLKMQKKISILSFVLDIFDWLITAGIYIYMFLQGFKTIILIGDVTAYIGCIDKIKSNATSVFDSLENIIEQSLYIDFLFQYLELPSETKKGDITFPYIEKIELINISYKYDSHHYVLKNISMVLNKNSHIALIGMNGSGKTTLIKLITGLYEDYEGKILINNVDMKEIDIEDYQRKVSSVFQDYAKYEMSIRENIGFGDIHNIANEQLVRDQIEKVHLQNKIQKTDPLDLNLGNWFGDLELSGGEWQRIAIARMLMKKAELFVLDEPDASLDILKQKEMIKIYEQVIENKISIYISHKVDYVYLIANYIYVLVNGEIVEYGEHKQLLNRKGVYYKLVKECNENREKMN